MIAQQRSISMESIEQQLHNSRMLLLRAREKRVRPGRDDKVLVSWNALMISAMADAGVALKEERYLVAAQRAADFLWNHLQDPNERLLHVWRAGQAEIGAFLDDYSFFAAALLKLWESDGNLDWLDKCIALIDQMIDRFTDPTGGFYFTATRCGSFDYASKDSQDGSIPSGNAMAATVLVRLWHWTGNDRYRVLADQIFRSFQSLLERAPGAAGQLLMGLSHLFGQMKRW